MISVGESLKNSDVTYKQRMADIDRDEQIEAEQRFFSAFIAILTLSFVQEAK